MKTIKIILCFFKKSPFLLLLILLELNLSMMLFVDQLGKLQYKRYALDIYKMSDLVNCDHFSAHAMPGLSASPNDVKATIIDAVSAIDGVASVGQARGVRVYNADDVMKYADVQLHRSYNVSVLTPSVFGSLPLELSDGAWQPDEKDLSKTTISVIACGNLATKYHVGDLVSVVVKDDSGGIEAEFKLKVVGRVASPGFSISLNVSSNFFSASDLFATQDSFIAVPSQTNYDLISQYATLSSADRCVMIRYEPGLDAVTLEQARASLRSWGWLTTPEEMIANSEERIREDFNERFPMLLFFLIISSFGMIASVVVTQMKMYRNNSVYYLCGATVSRCFFFSGLPIVLVGLPALLMNLGRILYFRMNPDLWSASSQKVLNGMTAAIVIGYFAVTIFLGVLSAYYVFKKKTPIESYRKNK